MRAHRFIHLGSSNTCVIADDFCKVSGPADPGPQTSTQRRLTAMQRVSRSNMAITVGACSIKNMSVSQACFTLRVACAPASYHRAVEILADCRIRGAMYYRDGPRCRVCAAARNNDAPQT
jgi:hypothetical protein